MLSQQALPKNLCLYTNLQGITYFAIGVTVRTSDISQHGLDLCTSKEPVLYYLNALNLRTFSILHGGHLGNITGVRTEKSLVIIEYGTAKQGLCGLPREFGQTKLQGVIRHFRTVREISPAVHPKILYWHKKYRSEIFILIISIFLSFLQNMSTIKYHSEIPSS